MNVVADTVKFYDQSTVVQQTAYYRGDATATTEQPLTTYSVQAGFTASFSLTSREIVPQPALSSPAKQTFAAAVGWSKTKARRLDELTFRYAKGKIESSELAELLSLRRLERRIHPVRTGAEYVTALREAIATTELTEALERYVKVVRSTR